MTSDLMNKYRPVNKNDFKNLPYSTLIDNSQPVTRQISKLNINDNSKQLK